MNESTFVIHTLHRGRFIQILLGSLFVIGIGASYSNIEEIPKIIALLVCLPVLLFLSVKWSQQPSTWSITAGVLHIVKGSKEWEIDLMDITYVQNHMRSGGNLIAIHQKKKFQPLRFWRNKLFQSVDEMAEMFRYLESAGVPVTLA
ncbi:hypothetical protein M8998_12175 [Sphingobacterium sp. lm-10]|uniref:hypothetical protein n=1 Tax=Sphingobacterium sp. lm-10 TaxID=2944904 RepID=UPI002020CC14|nr:hypothetical protein [Sphingobacterium sp. lm-10]MCL7988696.1 hypothetical protein [Sphingobacterium sp. lm-10]